MTHEVTRESVLASVQQLTPVIREYADRGEQERHLADPVVEALWGRASIGCSSRAPWAACRWITP